MAGSDILAQNELKTNRLVCRSLLFSTLLVAIVWIFNQVRIFWIEFAAMDTALLLSALLMLVPALVIRFTKQQGQWIKYLAVFNAVLMTGVLYTLLTYHALLMFIYPLFLASLYFDRKLVLFTTWVQLVILIISHPLGYYLHVVPDDPLTSMEKVVLYGILPRMILYMTFAFIALQLVRRNAETLAAVSATSDELRRSNEAMDAAIEESHALYETRSFLELAPAALFSTEQVLSHLRIDEGDRPELFFCVRVEENLYLTVSGTESVRSIELPERTLNWTLGGKTYSVTRFSKEKGITRITKNAVDLRYYTAGELDAFLYLGICLDSGDETTRHILEILNTRIRLALKNVRAIHSIFKNQEELVFALAELSESKSPFTGTHVKRVAEYTRVLGQASGMNAEECLNLGLAAMLHDVGKIAISPDILEKPGKLTSAEFELIKTHVTVGENLLKNSPGEIMQMARRIALEHHEKWNGKGYLGKRADEIDYNSRLVAIADVFDALVSKRPYKAAWNCEDARAEILSQSGQQFDPEAVRLFNENYDSFVRILKTHPDSGK